MSLRSRRRRKLKRLTWRLRAKKRRQQLTVPTFQITGTQVAWGRDDPYQHYLYTWTGTSCASVYSPNSTSISIPWPTTASIVSSGSSASITSFCGPMTIQDTGIYESFPAENSVPASSFRVPVDATEEQKTELRERHLKWRAEYVQKRREQEEEIRRWREEREAASIRARSLLIRHMTPTQRESYEKDKRFEVRAPSGNRYVLHDFLSANIDVLGPDDQPQHRLCIHIGEHDVPREDTILVQKIMLESGLEDELTRLANKHPIRRPEAGGVQISNGQLFATSALTFIDPQHTEFVPVQWAAS